jgi:hypothetical protein
MRCLCVSKARRNESVARSAKPDIVILDQLTVGVSQLEMPVVRNDMNLRVDRFENRVHTARLIERVGDQPAFQSLDFRRRGKDDGQSRIGQELGMGRNHSLAVVQSRHHSQCVQEIVSNGPATVGLERQSHLRKSVEAALHIPARLTGSAAGSDLPVQRSNSNHIDLSAFRLGPVELGAKAKLPRAYRFRVLPDSVLQILPVETQFLVAGQASKRNMNMWVFRVVMSDGDPFEGRTEIRLDSPHELAS